MTRGLASLVFPLLFTLPLSAQEGPPAPAAELARLKPFVGHWKGSGTATMPPGAKPSTWTAQVECQWTLGGHWLMTDTSIAFEDGGMGNLRFREYMGWDRENQRYVTVAVNNMGEGSLEEVHFIGNDTMVVLHAGVREGLPQAERTVTKYGADAQTFTITFLGDQGAASDGVSGKLERVQKVEPEALEAAHAVMPVNPAMAKIARMNGRFEVAGEMTMMPGMPAAKIQGTNAARSLFDGAIVQVTTTGTAEGMPGTYEEHGYYAFDATAGCYRVLSVSNMGDVMEGRARFAGDADLIVTYAMLHMGQPCVARTVVHLDGSGQPTSVVNHSCSGAAAPMKDFSATYKPAK